MRRDRGKHSHTQYAFSLIFCFRFPTGILPHRPQGEMSRSRDNPVSEPRYKSPTIYRKPNTARALPSADNNRTGIPEPNVRKLGRWRQGILMGTWHYGCPRGLRLR